MSWGNGEARQEICRAQCRYLKLGKDDMPKQRPSWRCPHIKEQGVNHGHRVHCPTTSLSALFNSKFSMEIWVQPLTF